MNVIDFCLVNKVSIVVGFVGVFLTYIIYKITKAVNYYKQLIFFNKELEEKNKCLNILFTSTKFKIRKQDKTINNLTQDVTSLKANKYKTENAYINLYEEHNEMKKYYEKLTQINKLEKKKLEQVINIK